MLVSTCGQGTNEQSGVDIIGAHSADLVASFHHATRPFTLFEDMPVELSFYRRSQQYCPLVALTSASSSHHEVVVLVPRILQCSLCLK